MSVETPVIDLLPEFRDIVRGADSEVEFNARFWAWLDHQRSGPLAPLLSDMIRLWSGVGRSLPLGEARAIVQRLSGRGYAERSLAALARFAEVVGRRPECTLVLVVGLRRPEGYSRFDRGRNTIFLGLDHPSNLRHDDHFEVILSHELVHAVRDPAPAVLADYGGFAEMSHDDFVSRHPFREHLVSEALATSVSEACYPGHRELRYVYFDPEAYAWCESHRRAIAERMLQALADEEDYRTFYAEDAVGPGSPDCCDYYFGFHLGRFARSREPFRDLIVRPSTDVLGDHLQAFLDRFLEDAPGERIRIGAAEPEPEGEAVVPEAPQAGDVGIQPPSVQRFYRELLVDMTGRPDRAVSAQRSLEAEVAREGLSHGGRPYGVWAFPLALATEDVRYIRWVTEQLLRTIERVVDLYRRDPAVRGYFAFPAHLEALIRLEPGYRPYVPIARFDSYWNGRRIRFLELNANGTAGIVLGERVSALYAGLDEVWPVLSRRQVRVEPLRALLIETFEAVWKQARVARRLDGPPRCTAIVDWDTVPSLREQEQLALAMSTAGLHTVLADPSQLAYDGTTLTADGRPIDIVYRRLTVGDVLEHADRLAPLLDAARDGNVTCVGSFAADLAHSKKVFAFLTHERWRRHFSMEERSLIDAHVPWTRIFRDENTLWGGQLESMPELARRERERFVLKPSESFEGRDVLLGVETPQADWDREIERRLGLDHVLQEYVPAPVRTVYLPRSGKVLPSSLNLHLGEFLFGGELAGFLVRASAERVLSTTSEERVIPCLTLEDEDVAVVPDELSHP